MGIKSAIEKALQERWQLDSQTMRYYNEIGKACAGEVDLSRWLPLVEGQGWNTALACAMEAADLAMPSVDVGGAAKRAYGCVREGLKSGLYVRLIEAQKVT